LNGASCLEYLGLDWLETRAACISAKRKSKFNKPLSKWTQISTGIEVQERHNYLLLIVILYMQIKTYYWAYIKYSCMALMFKNMRRPLIVSQGTDGCIPILSDQAAVSLNIST
jgi:hypothetical protein